LGKTPLNKWVFTKEKKPIISLQGFLAQLRVKELINFEDSTWKTKIMQPKYWKAFSGFSFTKIFL
jgi:hypothetical protein